MARLVILDSTGHRTLEWSKEKTDEVRAAKAEFQRAVRCGYAAFRLDGEAGEQVKTFDPDAAEIMLVPALVGG